jgi:hypothetical protein
VEFLERRSPSDISNRPFQIRPFQGVDVLTQRDSNNVLTFHPALEQQINTHYFSVPHPMTSRSIARSILSHAEVFMCPRTKINHIIPTHEARQCERKMKQFMSTLAQQPTQSAVVLLPWAGPGAWGGMPKDLCKLDDVLRSKYTVQYRSY